MASRLAMALALLPLVTGNIYLYKNQTVGALPLGLWGSGAAGAPAYVLAPKPNPPSHLADFYCARSSRSM